MQTSSGTSTTIFIKVKLEGQKILSDLKKNGTDIQHVQSSSRTSKTISIKVKLQGQIQGQGHGRDTRGVDHMCHFC